MGGAKFYRFALFPLMLLMLLLLPTRMVAQTANGNTSNQAYAEFEKSTGTLTFKCGPKPAGAYDLNEGENLPRWYAQRDKIKTVVFDASFANARPTSCYRWFCYCYNLTTIEGIEYLNTEKVMNMKDMFYRCSALTSLDLSNFNTKNVTDMSYMFCSCSALTTIFVSDKFVTGQVTSSVDMVSGCDKLIGAIKYVEKIPTTKITPTTRLATSLRKADSLVMPCLTEAQERLLSEVALPLPSPKELMTLTWELPCRGG